MSAAAEPLVASTSGGGASAAAAARREQGRRRSSGGAWLLAPGVLLLLLLAGSVSGAETILAPYPDATNHYEDCSESLLLNAEISSAEDCLVECDLETGGDTPTRFITYVENDDQGDFIGICYCNTEVDCTQSDLAGGLVYNVTRLEGVDPEPEPDCSNPGSGCGDPHLKVCGADYGSDCHGRTINIISEERHSINFQVNRLPGPDTFPHAGSAGPKKRHHPSPPPRTPVRGARVRTAQWLTGLGLAYAADLRLEARLRTDVEYRLIEDPARKVGNTRALHPTGGEGGHGPLLASITANGKSLAHLVGSGETVAFGAARVFFPSTRHSGRGEEHDGPVLVASTPDIQLTLYLESDDIWHFDFTVVITSDRICDMHGMLGQSMHWEAGAPARVEGGSDLLYAIEDGLAGTRFKFSRFGVSASPVAAAPHSRKSLATGGNRRLVASGGGAAAGARALQAARRIAKALPGREGVGAGARQL
ncbi:MAG: hypothetical protein J3K34DRAFT_458806 [Monoraphidium minutum]|nr:MAG: hypothetical protein J3K34DRAFT_458806 [Monoraphidium minutum]